MTERPESSAEDEADGPPEAPVEADPPSGRALARLAALARRADGESRSLLAARLARELLPGDSGFGDPLSTTGDEPAQVLGRRLSELRASRPSVIREAGLGAIQVWQAVAEAQGRGRGDREVAILFTDLVGFSSWALEAGDEAALELLREVGRVDDAAIKAHDGRVVKRLGDGVMAVFDSADQAVEAAWEAQRGIADIEVAGHRPRLRAGVHVGRPRKLGGDYLGVDVNIAARVAAGASGDEVLLSEAARLKLESGSAALRRRWRFRAKGAPHDLKVYLAKAPDAGDD